MFSTAKANETERNSTFALGPTTETGNEKRRTLSLRKGVITEQKKIFRFLLIKSVHEKSLKNWQIYFHHLSVIFNRQHLQETLGLIIAGVAASASVNISPIQLTTKCISLKWCLRSKSTKEHSKY